MPPKIVISLPADRTQPGTLRLRNNAGRTVAGPFAAFGKADGRTAARKGNPGRSPILPFGDTPHGVYEAVDTIATGDGTNHNEHSYGPHGAIRLRPRSGEAKLASDAGRTGLLIHGGAPSTNGGLRPTNGCIRLSNDDMNALLNAMTTLGLSEGPPDRCEIEDKIEAIVVVLGPDDGYDEGDPPPGLAGNWGPPPRPLP